MADDPSWTPRQDMSLLCRVCANQHDYLIPIFEGEGLDHDMPNKMDKHLPIKVRENDKLPTQMCYQCASTIIAWSELVTNCLEADKKLSRMLKVNENKADTSAIADEDAGSDHYEDAYDDVGGGGDDDNDDDDEDFEKEIKQLISDAGVKIVVPKAAKAKTTRASTRKRKSEAVPVKKENKKSKPDTSVSKSSTALIKPKEEVTSGEDRWVWYCCQCSEHFENSSKLVSHSALHNTNETKICNVCNIAYIVHLRDITQLNETSIKVEIVEVGEDDEDYDDVDDFENLALSDFQGKEEGDFDVFICNYCLVYFISKTKLKVHMKLSHNYLYGLVEVYECYLCENPKTYSRIQDIKKHMRRNHNEEAADISKFVRKANAPEVNSQLNKVTNTLFECVPCAKTYARKQDIIKHMRSVHGKDSINPNQYRNKACMLLLDFPECKRKNIRVFKCEFCEEHYTEATSLGLHMRTTHERNITENLVAHTVQVFGCKFCHQDNFLSLETLKLHCLENHNYQPHIYVCPQCNAVFSYSCNMGKHLTEEHAGKTWTNRDLLNCIVRTGKDVSKLERYGTLYGCNLCSKTFAVQEHVESHLEHVHKASTKEFITVGKPHVKKENKVGMNQHVVCDKCDQTFSCKQSLTNHISEHVGIDKLVCHLCNEQFDNLNSIWSHYFAKHPSVPYQCSMCSLTLDRQKEVVKHMGREHGVVLVVEDPEKVEMLKTNCRVYVNGILRYKCQECSAVLTSFRTLQTHMFRHTGEKPIVCDKCSKQFRTTSALRTHITSVHENVRKFGCEYCGHAFACSSNLAQHIRIHTGEKPYVCELCGNRYAQYASLYSHKLTHAQNRCHICTECGRAFHRVSRLRQHMKIHTGDRPPRSHICDICHKGFRTNSEMKRHQLIHNSIRSYVCETCGSGFTLRKYLIQHYKIHRDLQEDPSQNVSVETITDLGYAA